jgi:restriction system protein
VITDRGQQVLAEHPAEITAAYLRQFPAFVEFLTPKQAKDSEPDLPEPDSARTPEEEIEEAYVRLRQGLSQELLSTIKQSSPAFFERLVIDLLVKMGYGGTRKDAGEAVGHSGDGGIDGIIKEDRLGLDIVYIQAKRWDEGVVGRPEIQKFAGALAGQKAKSSRPPRSEIAGHSYSYQAEVHDDIYTSH